MPKGNGKDFQERSSAHESEVLLAKLGLSEYGAGQRIVDLDALYQKMKEEHKTTRSIMSGLLREQPSTEREGEILSHVDIILEALKPNAVSERRERLTNVQPPPDVPELSRLIERLSLVFKNEETTTTNLLSIYRAEQKKVGIALKVCAAAFTIFAIEMLILAVL